MNNLSIKPWSEKAESVVKVLGADLERGLSGKQIDHARTTYGKNTLTETKRVGRIFRFAGQFRSPVVLVLILATVVSGLLGEYVDSIAIAAIVFLNSCIGYFQESKAEAAIEALKKMSVPKTRVIRDGETQELSSEELVPGDLLVLEAGDFVPADARILRANQLSADESVLTGESLPVNKSAEPVRLEAPLADRNSMLFSGTALATGSAQAVVTTIGMQTEVGQIAGLLNMQIQTKTPLQDRLEQVSRKLLWFCGGVVLIVAILGLLNAAEPLEILFSAISLAVAAIPEGLPAVVTLALALAVRRMVKKNAIVRHLPAVETLGTVSVICTDKTGTLTTGKMRAREVFTQSSGVLALGDVSLGKDLSIKELAEASVLCSNATVNGESHSTGDPTEVALLYMACEIGLNPSRIHQSRKRLSEWSFDSDRKRMSVAVQNSSGASIVVKGAPESILPLCSLSTAEASALNEAIHSLSAQGRRLLAVGIREDLSPPSRDARAEDVECDLKFLGVVSIADPPRPESIVAIRKCKAAGIKVVMITGDHPITAQAIASELGIVEKNGFDRVLTGTELDQLNDAALRRDVESTAVYARVSPQHKLRIVNAWKERGEIVAMTGDGVNDAPALKAASIGLAMGKGGTEVARQASGMILADDNFATIVSGIEEGRGIYGNISRTIQYLLSGNFAEILIMFGAALIGWPAPLAPIHLLWINLVTDGIPALALAAEPIPKDILSGQSRPSSKSFLSRKFYSEIGIVGGLTALIALMIYGYALPVKGELVARTYLFSFLVYAELFRSFASRSDLATYFQLGPRSNMAHLLAVAFPVIFQFSLHHSTTFNNLFRVTAISWTECLGLLALTLVPVTLLEIRKLIFAQKRELKSENQILRSN